MTKLTGKGKPFHSALDRALASLPEKASPEQVVNHLLKMGVKPQELIDRRLDKEIGAPLIPRERTVKLKKPDNKGRTEIVEPYFETTSVKGAKAIPRSAVEELAAKNPMYSPVEKVFKQNPSDKEWFEEVQRKALYEYGRPYGELDHEQQRDVERYTDRDNTYHGDYTLPGGENYREILIKAPEPVSQQERIMELESKLRRLPVEGATPEQLSRIKQMSEKLNALKTEEGAQQKRFEGVQHHFGGEPGILASMRVKDRTGPNGEKLLHLEELQSDWHQQGREKGYHDPEKLAQAQATIDALKAEHKRLGEVKALAATPEEREAISEQRLAIMGQIRDATIMPSDHVPDAPFKKNWEEMALKRLVHHAAEKGYHGIVVTPGEEQADRYSLANVLNEIHYDPQTEHLAARDHEGKLVLAKRDVSPKELESHIGKEAAQKILSVDPNQQGVHSLVGQDIKVGGEGMKGFYDKKVPNILNAIGKKHKVKTQLHGHTLAHPKEDLPAINEANAVRAQHGHPPVHQATLHHFPITEDMRKDILTNGLPLYADGGIIKKAQGGTVLPTLEQMKMELMKKAKPDFNDLRNVGINEAPGLDIKAYVPPSRDGGGPFPVGGVSMGNQPLPMGGVDLNKMQPGNQLMPANLAQPAPQAPQGMPPGAPSPLGGDAGAPAPQGGSNILQMTPQGQAMAAMKPQGMAVGGEVENSIGTAFSPSVPQMTEGGPSHINIDDPQQLAHGGEVLGYKERGYVHHTDINPHPKAGKRFVAEQLPGLMPEHPVDMDELYNQRASLQLRPWDSTSRHVKVTNVSGHDLTEPLITEGGQGFARDIALNKEGISGASGREIQGRIQSRANAAHEENIKQGGRGHTYDIIANMDKVAPLFTNMPLHVQLDLLKQANLSPKELEHILNRVRSKKVQGKTPFTKMLPLNHPESMKQLVEVGALRKALSEELASKTNQKLLDYNLEDLLGAVTDPHIHAAPAGYAGNTFIANVPHAGLGPKRHSVYDTSGYGEYAGKGAQVPAELYMADTFERVSRELQKQFPKAGASAIRAMTIGALQTRKGNVSQVVNDRVMKNIERFNEGVKKGNIQNPNDLYGVLGHFYKEYGGYKKGGAVKKAKSSKVKIHDSMDTINLELSNKRKKAK